MKKADIVKEILKNKNKILPAGRKAKVFAPANIALCKYWGKRDLELNLPVTSSLSIALGDRGTQTEIRQSDQTSDVIRLNQQLVDSKSEFYQRLSSFFDLLPGRNKLYFYVDTYSSIPTAAGLASSASGFAATVMALDQLFQWNLAPNELSILARLGSGSACRSLWQGFVEWQVGNRTDGMDSFAKPLKETWPELTIGLYILSDKKKPISSREAMQRTIASSPFYSAWPDIVRTTLSNLKQAIKYKDFTLLGKTAESNAMAMHATMLGAWPPVVYTLPETISVMNTIWKLRREGIDLYFTQDAGPNLKLLFLNKDCKIIHNQFPRIEIVKPFLYK